MMLPKFKDDGFGHIRIRPKARKAMPRFGVKTRIAQNLAPDAKESVQVFHELLVSHGASLYIGFHPIEPKKVRLADRTPIHMQLLTDSLEPDLVIDVIWHATHLRGCDDAVRHIREDRCGHGLLTVNRMNIWALPEIGALKTCTLPIPVSAIDCQWSAAVAVEHSAP